jgi:ectoine hydroxylase-related dioxygenase (phytanoyl-CoA dioxygenase family)
MSTTDKIAELQEKGFCLLKGQFPRPLIESCREAFWPVLTHFIDHHHDEPNRGPHRHFLAMPFTAPSFAPEFFFNTEILKIVHGVMGDRVVADQWSCDVPIQGSMHQEVHVDYQHPLFPEVPELLLPAYMLTVSFGLIDITADRGPLEIAPGTHRMPRHEAVRAAESDRIEMKPVLMQAGDVLIRHPWALHRGTPNITDTPRALVTIRYVRRWYIDDSREVNAIPLETWNSLTPVQQKMMRFPVEG